MSQEKITKLDLRTPNELFAQIKAIAIEDGAKIHHISGEPIVSKTAIRLIEDGVRLCKNGYNDERQDLIHDMQVELEELVTKLVARSAKKLAKKLRNLENKYAGSLGKN